MARSSADSTGDLGFRPVKRALVIGHDEHGPAEGAGDHLVERGYQPIFEFSVVRPPEGDTKAGTGLWPHLLAGPIVVAGGVRRGCPP